MSATQRTADARARKNTDTGSHSDSQFPQDRPSVAA